MRRAVAILLLALVAAPAGAGEEEGPRHPYTVVDTGQVHAFDDRGQIRKVPKPGQPFFGQDAFYRGAEFHYRDNGDGTVDDLVTGLQWVKTPDLEEKATFKQAVAGAKTCRAGGHRDWRLPSIKELFSLIDFNGDCRARPARAYLDTEVFDFRFGERGRGERPIDAQYWSATEYVGRTMRGDATVFGVNFADGRIKGYPRDRGPRGEANRQFVRYVRGNPDYGRNDFLDNRDGTVTDRATGLMWTRADSGEGLDWEAALAWAEGLETAGHADWRLPNVKELQSLVDYTRAPDASDRSRRGPAMDPVFSVSDPEGWCWSSTTHLEGGRVMGAFAAYVAFGRATGNMGPPEGRGPKREINVHGAGAQRSDPKSGDPTDWSGGMGPQGDTIRILNLARAVRNVAPREVRRADPATDRIPVSSPPKGPPPGDGPPDGRPPRPPPDRR